MELVGSLFLVLALAVIVALYVGRPFLFKTDQKSASADGAIEHEHDHAVSALLAERDRVLNSLQELDFDYSLGKIPAEEYPQQREALLRNGADVLRKLDQMVVTGTAARSDGGSSAEDRIEAAVAARRADAMRGGADPLVERQTEVLVAAEGTNGNGKGKDALEELIAARKRQRKESAGGFCPRCGKPVQKSDMFCSKCGATL